MLITKFSDKKNIYDDENPVNLNAQILFLIKYVILFELNSDK